MKVLKPRKPAVHRGIEPLFQRERSARQLDAVLLKANLTREALRERVRQALAK
jgi:hypothetical protein